MIGLFDDILGQTQPPSGDEWAGVSPNMRNLLTTVYGSESPDYNVMHGGGRFNSYADHPRIPNLITSGPNAGKKSTAAGKPQFLTGTWDEVQRETGLPDFSPNSQNRGASHLAIRDYKKRTGRDLEADLELAGSDPAKLNMIGKYLSGTWTSLPGGIEPNKATGSFGHRYAETASKARPAVTGLFDDILTPSAPEPKREPEGPPMADVGRPMAAASGVAKGLTFNMADELAGVQQASGLPPWLAALLPGTSAIGAARLGYEKLTGKPGEATKRYEQMRDAVRNVTGAAELQYPGTTLAGEVGGAIANPATRIAGPAASLGGRALQAARGGAVYGGLSGAGEGTDAADRLSRATSGALVGGVMGGVGAPAVEGLVRGAGVAAAPLTRAVRGMVNPEAEAARTVTRALERDMRSGGDGLTVQQFQAARAAGAPVTVADMGGELTRGVARSAANTSPEARTALNNLANARFEGQAERATTFLKRLVGGVDTHAAREGLRTQAQAVNRPAYQTAYNSPRAASLWDQGFEQLMQAPAVQAAARKTVTTAANDAAVQGFTPIRNPFRWDAQGRWTLRPNVTPNLQFWDHVQRNLRDAFNTAQRSGANNEARQIAQLRDMLVQRLDAAVPEFQTARAGAARFFGANDALEAGENFVRSAMTAREGARALAQMSPADRALFRQGFAAQLIDDINNTRDRVNVLNKIGATPNAQQKIDLALGQNGAREVAGFIRVEEAMDRLRTAVQGNSTTARQLVELGLAGGVGGFSSMSGDPMAMAHAAAVYGLLRGQRGIDQRVAQRVAQMLTSTDPNVLAQGVRLATRNQNIMRALQSVEARLGAVGGQQGTGMPALQSMGYGRADQDQPGVPRPLGQ